MKFIERIVNGHKAIDDFILSRFKIYEYNNLPHTKKNTN